MKITSAILIYSFLFTGYANAGDFGLTDQDTSLKATVHRWVTLEGRKVVWDAPDFPIQPKTLNSAGNFTESRSASESIEQLLSLVRRYANGKCEAGDIGYTAKIFEKGEVAVVIKANIEKLKQCNLLGLRN